MKEPMRVLCVFGSLDRGGAETMCMNLFRNIDREHIIFDFVKHTEKIGAYESEIKQLGGRIYTCPALTVKSYLSYIKWWDMHFQEHPEHEIVHGHMFTTSGIYFREAHKYGRITIAHSHCASDENVDKRTFVERFIRKKLRDMIPDNSDVCLACSNAAGKLLFPHNDFYILNNAIDVGKYTPNESVRKSMRKAFSVPDGSRLFVVVGSFTAVKNPHGTVSICKAMQSLSNTWKLVWCGNGDMIDSIKREVHEFRLDDNIVFAGVRSDVNDILRSADTYIMPSMYEGLPVAAIEAQAAGLPCYISDHVTKEVDITGLCHFLPIDGSKEWAKQWAEALLMDQPAKQDMTKRICEAGYDIRTTTTWLQNLYLRLRKQ